MKHISLRVIFQNGMCPVVPICMAVRTTLKLSIFILYPILLLYFYFCLFSFIQSQKLNKIIFSSLFNIFIVFHNSGFKGTLCGGKWLSLTGSKNAFNNLGTGYAQHPGSTARYGCCPANKYMSSPEVNPFKEADSCSDQICPAGYYGSSVLNDETSCQLCERGKSSTAGSTSCDLTTIKLPNGNGKHLAADRVGDTLERIVDDILGTDSSKKEVATKKYGPIENWDVSDVTDISWLFYQKGTMKAELSSWDVSRVTTMAYSM